MIWMSYIFKKNDNILDNMPFTGIEFGNMILKEKGLQNVQIEETSIGDHYDLTEKKVKVGKNRLTKKSLTSIAIISHEIGHAIQHNQNYSPLKQRTKLVKNTDWISKLANGIILIGLPVILSSQSFHLLKICLFIIIICLIIRVSIHLITLEVEIDASFNKAMPIIREKYLQNIIMLVSQFYMLQHLLMSLV